MAQQLPAESPRLDEDKNPGYPQRTWWRPYWLSKDSNQPLLQGPGASWWGPDLLQTPGASWWGPDPLQAPGGSWWGPDRLQTPGGSWWGPDPLQAPGASWWWPDRLQTPGASWWGGLAPERLVLRSAGGGAGRGSISTAGEALEIRGTEVIRASGLE